MNTKRWWQLSTIILSMVFVSCGDDGGGVAADLGPPVEGGQDQSQSDGQPGGCQCKTTEVCNPQGQCIPRPTPKPGELVGEFVLLHQISVGGTSITDILGKAEASLYDQEPLPQDVRKAYPTSGGMCYYEMGTIWPHTLPNGQWWPTGPGLGAGKLTFRAGAGPIELEPLDMGKPPKSDFAYFHEQVPPPLKDGAMTLSDFFDVKHVPFGASFSVEVAGGPDVGKQVFQGGEIPRVFTIDQPAVEKGDATAPIQQPLTIQWSAPQPAAMMEVFLTQLHGLGDIALISCVGEDTGSLTVPAAALQNLSAASTGIQLRRSITRYQKVTVLQGKTLHLYLVGRHARVAKYTIDLKP